VAICLKQTGRVIGDLFGGTGEDDEDNTASVSLEPQSAIRWPRIRARSRLGPVRTSFPGKAFRRLYAYVEDHNIPSQRLCEKLRMRREGVFVEFVSFTKDDAGNPVYENTIQYAILRREWMSDVAE
jgi:hypothetical protein